MIEPYGYPVSYGYLGVMEDGTKRLFATEEEYNEIILESQGGNDYDDTRRNL